MLRSIIAVLLLLLVAMPLPAAFGQHQVTIENGTGGPIALWDWDAEKSANGTRVVELPTGLVHTISASEGYRFWATTEKKQTVDGKEVVIALRKIGWYRVTGESGQRYIVEPAKPVSVRIFDGDGAPKVIDKAGSHVYSGLITSVTVPNDAAAVIYDNNDRPLAAFSFQNSGLKTRIENAARIEVVDHFPTQSLIMRQIQKSNWDGQLFGADGAPYNNAYATSFGDGSVTILGQAYPLDSKIFHTTALEAPLGVSFTNKANGYETYYEWITPTVIRSDSWAPGRRQLEPRIAEIYKELGKFPRYNNPAQYLGVYLLKE